METVRIGIADDHRLFRHGLRSLLEKQQDFKVVFEAENGREALDFIRKHRPDQVILDISMPDLNGIETARKIKRDYPETAILILSMHADRRFVLEAIEAGASGYTLKDSAFEEVAEAIRAISRGNIFLSQNVLHFFSNGIESLNTKKKGLLTPREREVLQLVAEGLTTIETAERLCVSVKTIETHRKHLMEKLKLHSIAELTKYAVREGLTEL